MTKKPIRKREIAVIIPDNDGRWLTFQPTTPDGLISLPGGDITNFKGSIKSALSTMMDNDLNVTLKSAAKIRNSAIAVRTSAVNVGRVGLPDIISISTFKVDKLNEVVINGRLDMEIEYVSQKQLRMLDPDKLSNGLKHALGM